eukprot:gene5355-6681_t
MKIDHKHIIEIYNQIPRSVSIFFLGLITFTIFSYLPNNYRDLSDDAEEDQQQQPNNHQHHQHQQQQQQQQDEDEIKNFKQNFYYSYYLNYNDNKKNNSNVHLEEQKQIEQEKENEEQTQIKDGFLSRFFKRFFARKQQQQQNIDIENIKENKVNNDYNSDSIFSSGNSSIYNEILNNNSSNNTDQQQISQQQQQQEVSEEIDENNKQKIRSFTTTTTTTTTTTITTINQLRESLEREIKNKNAERKGRIIAEKNLEVESNHNRIISKNLQELESQNTKLWTLYSLAIKKDKQTKSELLNLSNQLSSLLDSFQQQYQQKLGTNNNSIEIDEDDETNNQKITEDLSIIIDRELFEQFESVYQNVKSIQEYSTSTGNFNNNNEQEERLFLDLIKHSTSNLTSKNIPLSFNDISSD